MTQELAYSNASLAMSGRGGNSSHELGLCVFRSHGNKHPLSRAASIFGYRVGPTRCPRGTTFVLATGDMAADPGPNAEADASRAPALWKWLVADTFREHLGKAGRRQLERDRLHDALGDLGLCLSRIRSGEQVSFWCPTGLQWLNVGEIRPADGRCLENPTLAALLARKTELTQQEWDNCREADLGARDFVKVKSCYFRPARALPGDANMDAGDIGAAQAIGACRLCGADACGAAQAAGADVAAGGSVDRPHFHQLVSSAFGQLEHKELQHRWTSQVDDIFDRYAGPSLLKGAGFCSALKSLGLPEAYALSMVQEEDLVDLSQFQLLIEYFALHQRLQDAFAAFSQRLSSCTADPASPEYAQAIAEAIRQSLPLTASTSTLHDLIHCFISEDTVATAGDGEHEAVSGGGGIFSHSSRILSWLPPRDTVYELESDKKNAAGGDNDHGVRSDLSRILSWLPPKDTVDERTTISFDMYKACVAAHALDMKDLIDSLASGRSDEAGGQRESDDAPGGLCTTIAQGALDYVQILENGDIVAMGDRHARMWRAAVKRTLELATSLLGTGTNKSFDAVSARLVCHVLCLGSNAGQWHDAIRECDRAEFNKLLVMHLRRLSRAELLALIPWLEMVRSLSAIESSLAFDREPVGRVCWDFVCSVSKRVVTYEKFAEQKYSLVSALGLKMCPTAHHTDVGLIQFTDVGLNQLCAKVEEVEQVLQARRNVQNWISASIDLNALAASLASRMLLDQAKSGSQWELCLQGMTDESKVESWLQSVAKAAAPVLWKQIETLRSCSAPVHDAKDNEGHDDDATHGGGKFSTLAVARFGKIEKFYEGLDLIGLPQPQVFEQMRQEHESVRTFKVTNYGGETCPLNEWNLVVNVRGFPPAWAQEMQQKVWKSYGVWRELRELESYMNKDVVRRAGLKPVELVHSFARTHILAFSNPRQYFPPLYVAVGAINVGLTKGQHPLVFNIGKTRGNPL